MQVFSLALEKSRYALYQNRTDQSNCNLIKKSKGQQVNQTRPPFHETALLFYLGLILS